MAQTLQTLSIISFIVAGVCLALAIFFWFFFDIPSVIGDLTGRTARKSIARMRAANEKNGAKAYKTSKTNAERGKITDTMAHLNKSQKDVVSDERPETGILTENKSEAYEVEATGVLEKTTSDIEGETTGLLVENEEIQSGVSAERFSEVRICEKHLGMIEEVMIIHTDEVI